MTFYKSKMVKVESMDKIKLIYFIYTSYKYYANYTVVIAYLLKDLIKFKTLYFKICIVIRGNISTVLTIVLILSTMF